MVMHVKARYSTRDLVTPYVHSHGKIALAGRSREKKRRVTKCAFTHGRDAGENSGWLSTMGLVANTRKGIQEKEKMFLRLLHKY